jgi:ATP-dependent RNA helicase DDX51/DBP6
VLVASDAMTRGMDVEDVGIVVNYDMPVYAKTYVHRVGRTARAGRAGSAYTILRREEVSYLLQCSGPVPI